jgi:hypothetical protein
VLSALYGQHVDVLRVHDRVIVIAEQAGLRPAMPDGQIAHDENTIRLVT